MSKDFKEKYERVCAIKDKALGLLEIGLNQDIKDIDAKEIGELMDIVKDAEEAIKYAEEACYYNSVVKSMEDSTEDEKKYYMNKYIPEYDGKFYTPMNMARARDSRGRYMYTEPYMLDDRYDVGLDRSRMYYTEPTKHEDDSMSYAVHNSKDGRAWESRRGYMEAKDMNEDKIKTNKELEKFMKDMSEDITEMVEKMDPQEKAALKQKLMNLSGKIV